MSPGKRLYVLFERDAMRHTEDGGSAVVEGTNSNERECLKIARYMPGVQFRGKRILTDVANVPIGPNQNQTRR